MKCKSCKRDIPDNSIFCNWCGSKQLVNKVKREVTVAPPRQLPSGSWFGRVAVNHKRVPVTAKTEEAYYAKARAIKSGMIEAESKPKGMALGKCIDTFLSNNSNILSPSTFRSYTSYRENRFQQCMAWDIWSDHNWQGAINQEAEKVSAKTVINAWRLITAALKAQKAPVPEVKLPKKAKAERPWLNYKQIDAFLDAVEGEACELGALLALHSMRLSELIAVTPARVDLKKEEITVRGCRVLDKNKTLVYKEINKTDASFRTIPIVIPRLKELLTPDVMSGQYIMDTNEKRLYDQINRVCKKAGLPPVGVHGLRHSFASLCYHLDWTKKSTMQVGGWSNSHVVDEIYTHNADLDRDIKKMKKHYRKSAKNGNENGNRI